MCQSQTRLLTRVSNVALAETTEAFAFSSSLLFKKKKSVPMFPFCLGPILAISVSSVFHLRFLIMQRDESAKKGFATSLHLEMRKKRSRCCIRLDFLKVRKHQV